MNVVEHYDKLIDDNNDSFNDPLPLQEYMNKWDGQLFIDSMCLTKEKRVLEVGVGTGRLAARVISCCLKIYVRRNRFMYVEIVDCDCFIEVLKYYQLFMQ